MWLYVPEERQIDVFLLAQEVKLDKFKRIDQKRTEEEQLAIKQVLAIVQIAASLRQQNKVRVCRY